MNALIAKFEKEIKRARTDNSDLDLYPSHSSKMLQFIAWITCTIYCRVDQTVRSTVMRSCWKSYAMLGENEHRRKGDAFRRVSESKTFILVLVFVRNHCFQQFSKVCSSRIGLLLFTVTDLSTTYAVVIFRVWLWSWLPHRLSKRHCQQQFSKVLDNILSDQARGVIRSHGGLIGQSEQLR